MGGIRGNVLGNLVTQIYDEVFERVKVFAECKYDPLDPGDLVRKSCVDWRRRGEEALRYPSPGIHLGSTLTPPSLVEALQ
jgi:hypothetical protein